ncbi:carbonic anhydrase [Pedobacter ginsengisoli]|uniref:Carbonic anhydrase n=1 Tax=Pedobacter ginsengisoli TaxID=363852 RepID=A0A2D1U114_9SPHI|nr:carbonic anhydrase [Pedobacter ginsengisoli]ATP55301.1 carbonic anhydrase [Pedobacter ginsengisoli]
MNPTVNHQAEMTPDIALQLLKDGHERFINGCSKHRNLLKKVQETKNNPKPFATILSCMDSRVPTELILDQSIGDIFNIRIAGNVISPHVLGSLEYTITTAGSKLIVVMGHTNCGAVTSACNDVMMENLSGLLREVKTCISQELTEISNRTGDNESFVNKVSILNVYRSVQQILEQSSIIRQSVDSRALMIIPAMYDVSAGKLTFYFR